MKLNIRSNLEWEYAGLYYDEGISGISQNGRNGLLALSSHVECVVLMTKYN